MKPELQKKIDNLILKEKHDEEMQLLFPDIKHMAIVHEWKDEPTFRIILNIESKEQFKTILERLPVTNTQQKISSSGKNDGDIINHPFRIDINNPPVCNSSQQYEFRINYTSDKYDVDIHVPINLVKEFVTTGQRNITDCEHHYFTGWSMEKMRNHKLMTYLFKNGGSISWFGGTKTSTDLDNIEEIINFLKS